MSHRQALLLAILGVGCAAGAGAVALRGTPSGGGARSVERPGDATASSAQAVTGAAPSPRAYTKKVPLPPAEKRETPPGLAKARGWLNVTRTPSAADLQGRVVVFDFWTSCCINCMQTLPTLASLEKKHARDPFLVVGVHTQKFDAEPEVERLRAQVIRFGIHHPVAIDGDRGIWESWGVSGWPTVVVVDARGRVVWADSGEPDEGALDAVIESALAEGSDEHALSYDAPTFLGREVDPSSPLAFPEKIAKVPGGYAIADSGHDRIVFVDDSGRVVEIAGDGGRGMRDGGFDRARFAHPQGIAAIGDVVYVADTENHSIRAIDRKSRVVSTVAGTGALGHDRLAGEVDGKTFALRSPWDVAVVGGTLYVALAGSHQIATVYPAAHPSTYKVRLFAGTGRESRSDGARLQASFAQPSGLATDGTDLFVLDSETSSVRKVALATGEVTTLVGEALFVWGDKDGDRATARLQHPIGLAYGDGALWVADTYNSKVKRVDPRTGATTTIAGGRDHGLLFEPAGLTFGGAHTLLVADTGHAKIVRVPLDGGASSPWPLSGLGAPSGDGSQP